MAVSRIGRLATWVAVVALLLNAVLLGAAGLVAGRPVLIGGAVLIAVAAGVVLLAWRRHQRSLAELAGERQLLREEVLALRSLVRRDPE